MAERSPVIMVSSTVYGIEDLLNQVFGTLSGYGYTVWMSHKGTLPVHSGHTPFEACLAAVVACDLFLGIITPHYGSGRDGGSPSITHLELLKAVELKKHRWFLAHDHVVFARQLLKQYRFLSGGVPNPAFTFNPTKVMDDVRVIDMYEAAILDGVPLAERQGSWVQTYQRQEDALQFISSQLGDIAKVSALFKGGGTP